MAYSVSFIKSCVICHESLGTMFEQPNPNSGRLGSHRVTKTLDCSHTFHAECINRLFLENQNTCPSCRAPVKEADTYCDWTRDVAPVDGWNDVYRKTAEGSETYTYPDGLSEEQKEAFIKCANAFYSGNSRDIQKLRTALLEQNKKL